MKKADKAVKAAKELNAFTKKKANFTATVTDLGNKLNDDPEGNLGRRKKIPTKDHTSVHHDH